jgi:hypothetical protein
MMAGEYSTGLGWVLLLGSILCIGIMFQGQPIKKVLGWLAGASLLLTVSYNWAWWSEWWVWGGLIAIGSYWVVYKLPGNDHTITHALTKEQRRRYDG